MQREYHIRMYYVILLDRNHVGGKIYLNHVTYEYQEQYYYQWHR